MSMKRFGLPGITVIAFAIICAVCMADGEEPEFAHSSRNARLHYEISWPATWENTVSGVGRYGLQRIIKTLPEDAAAAGKRQVEIQVLHMPTKGMLGDETLLRKVAGAMAQGRPDTATELSSEALDFSGNPGLVALYEGTMDGEIVQTLMHLISTPDGLFVIIGGMPVKQKEQDWQEMETIIGSFRYGEQKNANAVSDTEETVQALLGPAGYVLELPEGWARQRTGAGVGKIEQMQKGEAVDFTVTVGYAQLSQLSENQVQQIVELVAMSNSLMLQKVSSRAVARDYGTSWAAVYVGLEGQQQRQVLVQCISVGGDCYFIVGSAPLSATGEEFRELAGIVNSFTLVGTAAASSQSTE